MINMFYSKTTGGFYTPKVHGKKMPKDAVAITDAEYKSMHGGQANGKVIKSGAKGKPRLVSAPPRDPQPNPDFRAAIQALIDGKPAQAQAALNIKK